MTRFAGLAENTLLTARVAGAVVVAGLVPQQFWPSLTRAIGRVAVTSRRQPGPASLPVDRTLAGGRLPEVRAIAVDRIAAGHASRLWGLREYVRLRHPPVDVAGLTHVEDALAAGRGVLLWVGRFAWASIVTKAGLWAAGYRVTHLSRPTHGFGTSAFAIRWLNPIWTRIEERFLLERLVMTPGAEATTLRALRRRLEHNGLVSISVGDEGVRTVEVPFLESRLRLATGPMTLALTSGAPLLPVFTVRGPSGGLRVEIETALTVPPDPTRRRREAQIALAYAARLEPWVRRYPGQWLG